MRRTDAFGVRLDAVVSSVDDDPQALGEGMLGVIADIHANPDALDAVLNHGANLGVDRWLVLGDVVAMGPEPGRVLEQLAEVDVVAFVAGNTERYVLTGDRPDPTFDEVAADPGQLQRLVDVAGTFAWTKGFLHAHGSLDLLRSFLPHVRLLLPDGTLVLAVHASLRADDGPGIVPDLGPDEAERLFPSVGAALVFGGHTHKVTDIELNGVRFINPGSVSNHDHPDVGATYSTLRLAADHHVVEHHEVSYDKQLAVDAILRSGIPGSEFLLNRYFSSAT